MKQVSCFLRTVFFGLLTLSVTVLDQGIKYVIRNDVGLAPYESIGDGIIKLTYYKNTGIAFGIPFPGEILVLVVGVVLFFLLYYYRNRIAQPRIGIPVALTIGGAIGNVLDRLELGYVLDYVSILIFPVFNLADVAIVIGICAIVFQEFRKEGTQSINVK